MAEIWTVESVKEELPDVKIIINGKVHIGQVRGRKNRFAGVHSSDYMANWQYSWSAIVNSLNHDRPLKP